MHALRPPPAIETLERRRLLAFADLVPSWGAAGVGPGVTVLAEQTNGKILAADYNGTASTPHLLRLNADGTPDTSFSSDGQVSVAAPIVAARQLSSGKIVVAYAYHRYGDSSSDTDDIFGLGVARYNPRGGLDTTFGVDGNNAVTFREADLGDYLNVADVAIATDGTAYLAAMSSVNNIRFDEKFSSFVVKFRADGQIDRAFGTDGVLTSPGEPEAGGRIGFARTIDTLALRDSTSLLVAGTEFRFKTRKPFPKANYKTPQYTSASAYITRFNGNGLTDTRFGSGGTFVLPKTVSGNHGNADGAAAQVLRDSDGRVLLVGRAAGQIRIVTLTAAGRPVAGMNTPQDDTVANSNDFRSAALLKNGNVIVASQGALYEARKTEYGFVFQPPRVPAGSDGKPAASSYNYGLFVLGDGDVLAGIYGRTVKISPGDGITPRDDEFPFARKHSISTTTVDEGYPDFGAIPALDAFYHGDGGGLKYRRRTAAGRWGAAETVDAAANAGIYLDGIGTSVVYTDGDTADLRFATRRKNGTWSIETIDSAGATGLYCSIVRTAVDTFAVAYFDRTKGDLRLARRGPDGVWRRETVDSRGSVGRYAKIALRPHGGLSVAYATGVTRGVRLAEQPADGGAWAFTDLATVPVDVDGLDVGYFSTYIDSEDTEPERILTSVAFYDASRSDLFVAYRPDTGKRFRLLHDKQPGVAGREPHVLAGATTVSFYDQGRNQIRTAAVVQSATSVTLVSDTLPLVARAGLNAAPVTAYTVTGRYPSLGSFSKGYTNDYAWFDPVEGVLKVRSPI